MFKVGDEVLVKAKIKRVDETDTVRPYLVYIDEVLNNAWITADVREGTKTYESGLSDAWDLAKKIVLKAEKGGFNYDDFVRIFGIGDYITLFEKMTVEEALAKIEAYKKEKSEIKVGDVIKYANTLCVVVSVFSSTVNALYEDGSTINMFISECHKTGKHIDIESLLKQIGE